MIMSNKSPITDKLQAVFTNLTEYVQEAINDLIKLDKAKEYTVEIDCEYFENSGEDFLWSAVINGNLSDIVYNQSFCELTETICKKINECQFVLGKQPLTKDKITIKHLWKNN